MFRTISVAVIACGLETGKVLAIADDSDEAGAKAVLVKDNGSKVQQWKFEKDGDHYKLVNRKGGRCWTWRGTRRKSSEVIPSPRGNLIVLSRHAPHDVAASLAGSV